MPLRDPSPRKPSDALPSPGAARHPLPEGEGNSDSRLSRDLDETIARREAFLTDYQDAAYAQRYRGLVDQVRAAETAKVPGSTALTAAVARYAFKLMAYKDEYEVARLHSNGAFQRQIAAQFEGDYTIHFHLAPPMFAKKDAQGRLLKAAYGPWMMKAFGLLAKFKFLRGGALDVFGKTAERRTERRLITDYFRDLSAILPALAKDNLAQAVAIASLPEHIRGYGHVKEEHLAQVLPRWQQAMADWRQPASRPRETA